MIKPHLREQDTFADEYLRFLKNLIDTIPNPMFYKDVQGRYTGCNKTFEEWFGLTAEQIIGKHVREIAPPEIADFVDSADLALLTQQGVQTYESCLPFPGGGTREVIVNKAIFHNPDGSIGGIVGTMQDISDRKRIERTLAEAEERHSLFAEYATDILWQMDLSGKFTYVSPAITRYGYTQDEWVGHNICEFLPEEERNLFPEMLFKDLKALSHRKFEGRMLRKDRSVAWAEVSIDFVIEDGVPIRIQGITRDITERKLVEEVCRQSQELYKLVANNVSDVIFTMDMNFRYTYITPSVTKLRGYTVEEVMQQNLSDVLTPASLRVAQKVIAEVFGKNDVVAYEPYWSRKLELEMNCKDGSTVWTEVNVSLIRDPQGNLVGILGLTREITDRKKAEAELHIQTSAINAAGDQIVITDKEGKILFVNTSFESETGYTAEEAVGENPRILKSGEHDEDFYRNMWDTILAGKVWNGEIINKRKDGALIAEDMTITPVKNEAGKIEHFIAIKRNITEKKAYEEQLDYLAHHDHLTGLPNRFYFNHKLGRKLREAKQQISLLAVIFIDLDHFKLINDTLGHNSGDILLKLVAERLSETLREHDTLARMGGDEFTVILENIDSTHEAEAVARRILGAFDKPFVLDHREFFVSVSIGISIYPDHGSDVETLVKNADTAMYRAKERHRNNYYIFTDSLNTAAVERMTLENDLRKALDREEFEIHYQPRVDVETGYLLGAEALLRWRHPSRGMIPPQQFIPVAEETGLIIPITDWILRTVCTQYLKWQEAGLKLSDVAVNISARHFQHEGVLDSVMRALKECKMDGKNLSLELTESTLIQNPDFTADSLHKLKAAGVRVSLDDFGTGYSSLSYLKRFPIDSLKIDRSFVRDITKNAEDAAIAKAVVAMAHSLRLKVVAEGVESSQQLAFLRTIGCDEMQGYLISHPIPPDQFEVYLRNHIRKAA